MRRIYGKAEVISDLRPGAQWSMRDNDYEQLQWYNDAFTKPTPEEIEARRIELEAAEPMRVLKEIRDWYLKESDWTQVQDLRSIRGIAWCAAWDDYRQQLRDMPADPTQQPYFNEMGLISGITWPEKPSNT